MSGLTPAFIVLLFSLTLSIFLVRKEHIIIPMIVAMCFLPGDIAVVIAGLNFYPLRILAISALTRLLLTPGQFQLKINSIDILFLVYNILGAIAYILASENKTGAFVYKAGVSVDSIVLYIVFRYILCSKKTIHLAVKTFSICVIILLPFVIYEYFAATNLFSILGRSSISIRDGEIRAAATFSHAILLGSFAAALTPLFFAHYRITRKAIYLFSILCCIIFIFACSSSSPVVALAGVIFFLSFFQYRFYSRHLAWLMILTATFIHFARESPIWHFLYVRMTLKASSTGYHRYLLMEAAIKEFKHWWLLGYGDIGADWHIKYWPWAHATFTDVTNHYLLEGVRGGIVTMIIFIILCFKCIYTLATQAINSTRYETQWLYWGVLVMMICHCISFLSVNYFGQITMLLYFTFAIAAYAQNLKLLNKNATFRMKFTKFPYS